MDRNNNFFIEKTNVLFQSGVMILLSTVFACDALIKSCKVIIRFRSMRVRRLLTRSDHQLFSLSVLILIRNSWFVIWNTLDRKTVDTGKYIRDLMRVRTLGPYDTRQTLFLRFSNLMSPYLYKAIQIRFGLFFIISLFFRYTSNVTPMHSDICLFFLQIIHCFQ